MRIGDQLWIFSDNYTGFASVREITSAQTLIVYKTDDGHTGCLMSESVNYINISASHRICYEPRTLFKYGRAYGIRISSSPFATGLSCIDRVEGVLPIKGRMRFCSVPLNMIKVISHTPAESTLIRLMRARLCCAKLCLKCGDMFINLSEGGLCQACNETIRYTCAECGEAFNPLNYDNAMGMCHLCLYANFYHCQSCNEWIPNEVSFLKTAEGDVCKSCSNKMIERIGREPPRAFCQLPNASLFERNPFKRHVGLEIEVVGSCFSSDADNAPVGWTYMEDTSVESMNSDEVGFEFISAPLSGDNLYIALNKIQSHISRWELYANETCGLHVHTSALGTGWKASKGLLLLMYKLEPIINRMISPDRMEKRYSQPLPSIDIGEILNINSWFSLAKLWYNSMGGDYFSTGKYNETRYRGFNLHSRFLRGTFEFRYYGGSTDVGEISKWAKFCLGLTEAGISLGSDNNPRINALRESIINNDTNVKIGDYLELMGMQDMYSYVMSCVRNNKRAHQRYLDQDRARYMLEQYNNLIE